MEDVHLSKPNKTRQQRLLEQAAKEKEDQEIEEYFATTSSDDELRSITIGEGYDNESVLSDDTDLLILEATTAKITAKEEAEETKKRKALTKKALRQEEVERKRQERKQLQEIREKEKEKKKKFNELRKKAGQTGYLKPIKDVLDDIQWNDEHICYIGTGCGRNNHGQLYYWHGPYKGRQWQKVPPHPDLEQRQKTSSTNLPLLFEFRTNKPAGNAQVGDAVAYDHDRRAYISTNGYYFVKKFNKNEWTKDVPLSQQEIEIGKKEEKEKKDKRKLLDIAAAQQEQQRGGSKKKKRKTTILPCVPHEPRALSYSGKKYKRKKEKQHPSLEEVTPTSNKIQVVYPVKEFKNDADTNLSLDPLATYRCTPGVENVHDGRVMIRVYGPTQKQQQGRFIVLDYSIIPNQLDLEVSTKTPHIHVPQGAGYYKCRGKFLPVKKETPFHDDIDKDDDDDDDADRNNKNWDTNFVQCNKVGVPIVLYDNCPTEIKPLWSKDGLCFTCEMDRYNLQKKRNEIKVAGGETIETNQIYWSKMLYELLAFKIKHGHSDVSSSVKGGAQYRALYEWCELQRKHYKMYYPYPASLTVAKVADSSAISAAATSAPTSNVDNQHAEKLDSTKKTPAILVEKVAVAAAAAAAAARTTISTNTGINTIDDDDIPYYVTILNDERIQILNSIGFLWGTKWEIFWDKNFDALVKYKEEFGHTNVPARYEANMQLARWITMQRKQKTYKDRGERSLMTNEWEKRLNDIGFVWRLKTEMSLWEDRYRELVEYRERNGHCNVPWHFRDNIMLGRWVGRQRQMYHDLIQQGKKSKIKNHHHLTKERIQLLEDISFVWDITEADLERTRRLLLTNKTTADDEAKEEEVEEVEEDCNDDDQVDNGNDRYYGNDGYI